MTNRYDLALALIKQGALASVVVPVVPGVSDFQVVGREKVYPMESMRLALTSARVDGGLSEQSTQMPVKGRLVGLEFFVDTPSPGDYVSAKLRDKTLFPRIFIDLANKTSYEADLDEEIVPGDLLTVSYFSVDTASKTLTWTPSVRATR